MNLLSEVFTSNCEGDCQVSYIGSTEYPLWFSILMLVVFTVILVAIIESISASKKEEGSGDEWDEY